MRGGARSLLSGDGLSARDVVKKVVVVALGLATLGSGAVYLNVRVARAETMRLELGVVRMEGAAGLVVFLLVLLVVVHTVPRERCSNSSSGKSCDAHYDPGRD